MSVKVDEASCCVAPSSGIVEKCAVLIVNTAVVGVTNLQFSQLL